MSDEYSTMQVGTKDLTNKRNYAVKVVNKTPAQRMDW